MKLTYNQRVEFFEDTHQYLLDKEIKLSGITRLISKLLFPDKYADVPKHILDKAAAYGSLIHSKCQEQDIFNTSPDCVELENYKKLKEEYKLIPLETEYLVSDNAHVATLIDTVFEASKKTVHLSDIKTTANLDTENLAWQLSLGAYLFELQNPKIKVDKLFGIWLRKEKGKVEEIQRIDNAIIETLIEAFILETDFVNPFKVELEDRQEFTELEHLENNIVALGEEMAHYENRKKELLAVLETDMEASNQKKWETSRLIITRVLSSSSQTIDTKRLSEEQPELVKNYLKISARKGYMKLSLKEP